MKVDVIYYVKLFFVGQIFEHTRIRAFPQSELGKKLANK